MNITPVTLAAYQLTLTESEMRAAIADLAAFTVGLLVGLIPLIIVSYLKAAGSSARTATCPRGYLPARTRRRGVRRRVVRNRSSSRTAETPMAIAKGRRIATTQKARQKARQHPTAGILVKSSAGFASA